ncbi:hypothetical protein Cgig2_011344 [Carnegiea gigantea]|uniref:Uncharacterized protein n=1 Tax=Carnegiea gigantea TaxID=171969 RepID=A0A9Q1JTX2_9CARY|nr:hypothetical protein Cgig2_011344 [Carnegiea gigantea]
MTIGMSFVRNTLAAEFNASATLDFIGLDSNFISSYVSYHEPLMSWCAISEVGCNDELRIIEKYVYLTMGFPRGCKPVKEGKKSDKGDYKQVLDEWKDQLRGALPKPHQVLAQMRNQRQGADHFKRNFVVYVVFTLVKGQQNVPSGSCLVQEMKDCQHTQLPTVQPPPITAAGVTEQGFLSTLFFCNSAASPGPPKKKPSAVAATIHWFTVKAFPKAWSLHHF